jgi:hypothetical protein
MKVPRSVYKREKFGTFFISVVKIKQGIQSKKNPFLYPFNSY